MEPINTFSTDEKQNLTCPSYVCKPGAKLYGIVNADGLIEYLKEPIEVDETFIDIAYKGREPEKRFRFSGACAKSGCKQWNTAEHECGLINNVIDIIGNDELSELQYCGIRSKCRWYEQKKGLACAQCNEVIRNIEMKIIGIED